MSLNSILSRLGVTERDLIESIIAEHFFADYGFVSAVSGGKVDVRHAILPSVVGKQLGETVSKSVELLFPSVAGFSLQFPVRVGDGVLLIGLRHYLNSTEAQVPQTTDVNLSYTQETLKAIPLGAINGSAGVVVEVSDDGVITLAKGSNDKAVARVDDTAMSDASVDPSAWPVLTALAALVGMPLTSITSKINTGSSKVKAG